jgi:hypothetical protein
LSEEHRGLISRGAAKQIVDEISSSRAEDGWVFMVKVFQEVKELIDSALDGNQVCLMVYGQTSSGKSYTMEGRRTAWN